MNPELPNRRRYPRRSCVLTVELRTPGQSFPLRCQTTDISAGGCYIENPSALAHGTLVDAVIWAGTAKILAKGIVRTAHAGVGNGIEFTDIAEQARIRLEQYLATQDDTDSGSFTIIR